MRPAAFVVVSLVLTGCASYQPPPLTTNHPAHPEAPAAAEPHPSGTLAYTPADIASIRARAPIAMVPPEGHPARPADAQASRTVVGEGQVVATVPNASQLVVDHEEIKGFMEAMTMGYRIEPPSLLDGLKPGDKIRFTIDIQRRAIIAVEKAN